MTITEYNTILRHQQDVPIDITALATDLGLSVYESEDFEDGISGKICKDASGESPAGYSVYVNANHSVRRQRFTIAHECAHFLLHRDKIGDGITDDAMYRSDKMTNQDEYEANNKAADLLMPRRLVLKYVKEGLSGADDLADAFNVSITAMQVRLRYLLFLP
jgi:IrrE N-terminal-like domain